MVTLQMHAILVVLALYVAVSFPTLVVGQSNTTDGDNIQFQGPGYIACPYDDFQIQECQVGVDDTCSVTELLSCNFTGQVLPTVDSARTTVYFPLNCKCLTASSCPDSCTFSDGDIPTSPPIGMENFTGIGSVTCPTADLLRSLLVCVPFITNTSLCGTCDTSIIDINSTFGFDFTDEFFTFPLPCECLAMNDCPDTCTFTPGLNDTASIPTDTVTLPVATPVAAPVPIVDTPITSPTEADVPVTTPTTTSAPSLVPEDANGSVPTSTTTGMNATTPSISAPFNSPISTANVPSRPTASNTTTEPTSSSSSSFAYNRSNNCYFSTMALGIVITLVLSLFHY